MKVIYRLLAALNVVLYLFAVMVGMALGLYAPGALSLYSLHFKLSLGAVVMTLFLHSIVMIYFIVTHKAVKEGLDQRDIEGTDFRKQMRAMKMNTIPWTTMGMLIIIGATIVGAAVDTGHLPRWSHSTSALFAIGVNLFLFVLSYEKLKTNTELMHKANDLFLAHDQSVSEQSEVKAEDGSADETSGSRD